MSIGDRIYALRRLRGMSQKELGIAVGFSENSADVRIAQYENGVRSPKAEMKQKLCEVLDASPYALEVVDFTNAYQIQQCLFLLEDIAGLRVGKINDQVCLYVDEDAKIQSGLFHLGLGLKVWEREYAKFKSGEISKEEYDHWRYNYPELEAERWKNAPEKYRLPEK